LAGRSEAWRVASVSESNRSVRDTAGNGYQLPLSGARTSLSMHSVAQMPIDIRPDERQWNGLRR